MTEADWLACSDPTLLLEFVRGNASERKLRLFAAACCRRIWTLIADHRLQKAVKVAEQFADNQTTEAELQKAHANVQSIERSVKGIKPTKAPEIARKTARLAAAAVLYTSRPRLDGCLVPTATACADAWKFGVINADLASNLSNPGRGMVERARECARQSSLLRDLFTPFSCFEFASSFLDWKEKCVVRMAEASYWERSFQNLPILADALEEAGCTDAAILAHCRGAGPHVRGCWVVDLLLGKE